MGPLCLDTSIFPHIPLSNSVFESSFWLRTGKIKLACQTLVQGKRLGRQPPSPRSLLRICSKDFVHGVGMANGGLIAKAGMLNLCSAVPYSASMCSRDNINHLMDHGRPMKNSLFQRQFGSMLVGTAFRPRSNNILIIST